MSSQPSANNFERASLFFLRAGGLVLLIDAIAWGVYFLGGFLSTQFPLVFVVVYPAMMCIFFFGFPAIFAGVLALLVGLALKLLRGRSAGLAFFFSGVLSTGMGILAIVLPTLLVPAGSGDTQLAWMVGLTIFIAGIPLSLLGVVLIIIGLVKMIKRSFSSRLHSGQV